MDKELLNKYFRNECTPAEAKKVLEWINSNERKEEIFDQMDQEWQELDEKHFVSPQNLDSLSERINDQIKRQANSRKQANRRTYWMSAASVVLLAVISFYLFAPDTIAEGYFEEVTLKGERTTIYLSDGSSILLDADSKLIYPQELTEDNREVYLEGQAFFKLTSSRPLRINANNITTVAQATSFSVSAFPEKDRIVVAVEEGKAEVTKGDVQPLIKLRMPKTLPLTKLKKATVVKEKEYLAYNKEGDTMEKERYENENQVFGWKNGIIYFKDADTQEVTNTLERWYGVNICYDQEVEVLYSGEFTDQKIEDVLQAIGATSNVKYKLGDQCI